MDVGGVGGVIFFFNTGAVKKFLHRSLTPLGRVSYRYYHSIILYYFYSIQKVYLLLSSVKLFFWCRWIKNGGV